MVSHSLRIGYVGLGDIGSQMAHRIASEGWPLTVYARRAASLEPLSGLDVDVAPSLNALGKGSDILCVCVVDEHQVADVLFGDHGAAFAMHPGAIVLLHSTIAPEACRELAARLSRQDIDLVDAPVTGGTARARTGELSIPVGGSDAAVARCMPLLETEGSLVVRAGGVGAAQTIKLLNNGLYAIQHSLADEVTKLGTEMGLDRDAIVKVLATGSGGSLAFTQYAKSLTETQTDVSSALRPGGEFYLRRKDVGLLLASFERADLAATRMAELLRAELMRVDRLFADHGPSHSEA